MHALTFHSILFWPEMDTQKYEMDFQDLIGSGIFFVTYKKIPNSKSMAWMTVGMSKSQDQNEPPSGKIVWSINYDVKVLEGDASSSFHYSSVTQKANIGSAYEVTLVDGFLQFDVYQDGGTSQDTIRIRNRTNLTLNLGINLGGNLLATQSTTGGAIAVFDLSSSKYYVGVTRTRPYGEFTNSEIDAAEVQFPLGLNSALINLQLQNGQEIFSVPKYSFQPQETILSISRLSLTGSLAVSQSLFNASIGDLIAKLSL